ncbi:hypothetical protein ESB00_02710 [Oleiharenicola lentus]|uniref:Uncharacterized protein n=1 Tax=Oleiharenicola lentus TaxID=2508720 RepID=A0A4Q1C7D0_9BACT|nr:hypothetical protein [Oleiharenicola lentus]RXK54827.1 hypothetical protein ESB00_02710 [Oleiharenicola lentus]
MSTADRVEEAPWQAGLHSLRALFLPGLVLQGAAVAVVLAYYFVPAMADLFAQLGHWQAAGGYAFSAVSTAVCGGLLPFLFLRLNPATRAANPWPMVAFFMLFWAWKGAEVDLWYRILSRIYGDGNDAGTVVRKVLTDQFGFNPFYAAPVGNLCFAWKDAGFRWAPVWENLRAGRWYYRSVLPVLIAVWFLWIPVTACVYSLPSPLQMPLFNIVLCFWSMLFSHLTARQNLRRA